MSNHVYDITDIECCITCVIIQENGDTSGLTDAELAKWEKGVAAENVCDNGWQWSGVQCDDWEPDSDPAHESDEQCTQDGWFSSSFCEFCGDTNGGQRFNVAIMRKVV